MASASSASPNPDKTSRTSSGSGAGADKYPEQRHAGAVGYGPEYAKGVTTSEKLEGYKDEVKGKILRKPDVVQHGHDLRTGELKRKQAEDDVNPFGPPSDDKEKDGQDEHQSQQDRGGTPDVPKSDTNQTTAQPPSVEDTAHPSEKGQREQAATVAPEGTDDAEVQRRGSATENTKYIG